MSTHARMVFADLNLRHENERKTRDLVQRAIDLGYDCVAVNTDVGVLTNKPGTSADDNQTSGQQPPPTKRKKQKESMKSIPAPFLVDESKLNVNSLVAQGRRFRQYSRLTVTIDKPEYLHSLFRDPNFARYDIIAVRPETEQTLNTLSTKGEAVDLLCFEIGADVPWLYRGKLMNRAIESIGMAIELCYAPALTDSSTRTTFLANARQVLANAKCVVLSSGASKTIEQRGPYDAANLMSLCDLPRERCRKLVAANCERVLLRTESRQCMRGTAAVRPIDQINKDEMEMLKKVPEFAEKLGDETLVKKVAESPEDSLDVKKMF